MKTQILLREVLQDSINFNHMLLAKSFLTGKGRQHKNSFFLTQELTRSATSHRHPVPLLPFHPASLLFPSPNQKCICFKSEYRTATNSTYAIPKLIAIICLPPRCLRQSATCLSDKNWQPACLFLHFSVSELSCFLPVWKSWPAASNMSKERE